MPRFYEPDLGANPDSQFARAASGKLIRRSYWLDMTDRTLVLVMVNGIGASAKRAENDWEFLRLFRAGSERPCQRRTADCRDEFAPSHLPGARQGMHRSG
jgi:hypothetical protein